MMTESARAVRGPWFLRIAPLRWLTGELVTFGFLAVGLGLSQAVPHVGWIFEVIGLFGGGPLSVVYLFKMHGPRLGLVMMLMLIYVACFLVGAFAFGLVRNDAGQVFAASPALREVAVALLVLLAVAVGVAIATGERWLRRNPGMIAPTEGASRGSRQGNRGIWAPRVWLIPQ